MALTQSKWRASLLVTLGAIVGTAFVAFGMPFVSPFLADWKLDSELLGVVMDWRDFGEEKARQRLGFELERQKLSSHVAFGDCSFSVDEQRNKVVYCSWTVDVVLPLIESRVPLAFSSTAMVSENGDVSTW